MNFACGEFKKKSNNVLVNSGLYSDLTVNVFLLELRPTEKIDKCVLWDTDTESWKTSCFGFFETKMFRVAVTFQQMKPPLTRYLKA